MKLNIDIDTDTFCNLIVQDNTEYLNLESKKINPNLFKFIDTVSIVSIVHNDTREDKLKYFNIFNHLEDKTVFKVPINFDGVFEADYIVIPTKEWYDRITKSISKETLLNAFSNLLFIFDGENIVKITTNNSEIITIEDFLDYKEVNSLSISKVSKKLVSVCKLRRCYVNLCLLIFENKGFSMCKDKSNVNTELSYKRDLVWMAINVIIYMAKHLLYSEVSRLLSDIYGCNGLCNSTNSTNLKSYGRCRCSS